jgi:PBP1b-binding outer membrane lipoprotein LpoB
VIKKSLCFLLLVSLFLVGCQQKDNQTAHVEKSQKETNQTITPNKEEKPEVKKAEQNVQDIDKELNDLDKSLNELDHLNNDMDINF